MTTNSWRFVRRILLAATIVAVAIPAVALAGSVPEIQGAIARYEGTPFNTVHITSIRGGSSGSGNGWDCQSWWRFNGGTWFYSYNMQWFYNFNYQNNGGTVQLQGTGTNGVAC